MQAAILVLRRGRFVSDVELFLPVSGVLIQQLLELLTMMCCQSMIAALRKVCHMQLIQHGHGFHACAEEAFILKQETGIRQCKLHQAVENRQGVLRCDGDGKKQRLRKAITSTFSPVKTYR